MTDYVSVLSEIPAKHSGLIFEQIHRATMTATQFLRDYGLPLPGATKMPTHPEVKLYLTKMMNRALHNYFEVKGAAPRSVAANEIWGEDGDDLIHMVVTGLSEDTAGGFTAEIDLNLLYGGE